MFASKKRMTAIKKLIGNVHCEPVRMSKRKDMIQYCHKHDSEILYDKTQERTNHGHIILDTLGMMREGRTMREVIEA